MRKLYHVYLCGSGERVGRALLAPAKHANYLRIAGNPEGVTSLALLPESYYCLDEDWEGLPGEVQVFIA